jgi:tetratricopeptide (TPR) repeat protein
MPALVIGQRRKERLRRVLKRLALGLAGVAVCLFLSYTAFRRWTLLTPPVDEGPSLPKLAQVAQVDGAPRMQVGDSWMERRDGVWRINLTGDPRTMGHSHGVLARRTTAQIERHLARLMRQFVTTPFRRWLADNVVRWRFRNMPEHIPPHRLVELAAYSRTMLEVEGLPEEPFHRLVYYHALHDMTQRLDGSPIIGCTAFAAWGKKTVDAHLIVGRNFDFEGGEVFDRDKAVLTFHTPERIPFVSVAWPGMMGVVTGVNARRIYVSINAARTDEDLEPGIPMAFLVREILAGATSIDEALAIIKKHKVMVAEGLLIADGKVPEAVVVELAPKRIAVRRGTTGVIGLANHFLDRRFKADANNDWLRRYTTSDARYRRLHQLLRRFGGRIDAPTAAMILRNRTGLDDAPLSLGNRNALDALIATHGVVVDLTDMVLWVSRGPHLLGPLVAVDLKPIFGMPVKEMSNPEPIPADMLYDSAELSRFRQAEAQMAYARSLAKSNQSAEALDYARRAVAVEPDSAEARLLLGDLLWKAGRWVEAKKAYKGYLERHPPYLRDRERVKARLGQ